MGRREELRDDTVNAYVEATNELPDTRDYVAIETVVDDYLEKEGEE